MSQSGHPRPGKARAKPHAPHRPSRARRARRRARRSPRRRRCSARSRSGRARPVLRECAREVAPGERAVEHLTRARLRPKRSTGSAPRTRRTVRPSRPLARPGRGLGAEAAGRALLVRDLRRVDADHAHRLLAARQRHAERVAVGDVRSRGPTAGSPRRGAARRRRRGRAATTASASARTTGRRRRAGAGRRSEHAPTLPRRARHAAVKEAREALDGLDPLQVRQRRVPRGPHGHVVGACRDDHADAGRDEPPDRHPRAPARHAVDRRASPTVRLSRPTRRPARRCARSSASAEVDVLGHQAVALARGSRRPRCRARAGRRARARRGRAGRGRAGGERERELDLLVGDVQRVGDGGHDLDRGAGARDDARQRADARPSPRRASGGRRSARGRGRARAASGCLSRKTSASTAMATPRRSTISSIARSVATVSRSATSLDHRLEGAEPHEGHRRPLHAHVRLPIGRTLPDRAGTEPECGSRGARAAHAPGSRVGRPIRGNVR